MSSLEKEPCLGDSSGSDGSLAKDLSHQAEMNFSSQVINLQINDFGRSSAAEIEEGQTENEIEQQDTLENIDLTKEAEIAQKYIQDTAIPELTEQDCDSNEALMLCENCHGPITKMKKFGKSSQQFCSKQCADNQIRDEDFNDEHFDSGGQLDKIDTGKNQLEKIQEINPIESSTSQTNNTEVEKIVADADLANFPADFSWNEYREMLNDKAAPITCFGKLTKEVKGLKAGMKLEALDKSNPCNYCVATVIDVVGHRVKVRYDGFGNNDSQDFWCNFQAEELFPIGWCAENSFPLQPPTGITSTLEDWKTFLTKTLTGALAAPMDLFRENEHRLQAKVHSFQAGMRVECIHPRKPSIICPASITKSLGPFAYQITTEPLPHLPAHTFYGHSESNGIFSFGWTMKNGMDLALPAYVDGSGLTKDQYITMCKAKSAPPIGLHKRAKSHFRIDQKLEAVDLEEPSVIRVATVFNVIGRVLHLLFDGRRKFQYVDCQSEDIFPIGWCMKTGHPLSTPYGSDRSNQLNSEHYHQATESRNSETIISNLCANLITRCNNSNQKNDCTEVLNDTERSSKSNCCSNRRGRRKHVNNQFDCCNHDRIAPSLLCRCCSNTRDNCSSTVHIDIESDCDQETLHCGNSNKIRHCGYHKRHCYCCRNVVKPMHKRQPCCYCLVPRRESTMESEDWTEESEREIDNHGSRFAKNNLCPMTSIGLKRHRQMSRGDNELSSLKQAVNEVKNDITTAMEMINRRMRELTRKLNNIDEKLSNKNEEERLELESSSVRNSNNKVKRVARSVQVNLNGNNSVCKTRTKSSLQKKFSAFRKIHKSEINQSTSSSNVYWDTPMTAVSVASLHCSLSSLYEPSSTQKRPIASTYTSPDRLLNRPISSTYTPSNDNRKGNIASTNVSSDSLLDRPIVSMYVSGHLNRTVASAFVPSYTQPTMPVVSTYISSGNLFDRPTMAYSISSFERIEPTCQTIPATQFSNMISTSVVQKSPSFVREIRKTGRPEDIVESLDVDNTSDDVQEYRNETPVFNSVETDVTSSELVIESSFSIRNGYPLVQALSRIDDAEDTLTLVDCNKSPISLTEKPIFGSSCEFVKANSDEYNNIDAIFKEMPDDKVDIVRMMVSNSSMKRYEFSLKLLDLLFTDEEQCNEATYRGGILQNLDLCRVKKIKVYPTAADQIAETEQITEENTNRSMVLPSFHTVLGKNSPAAKDELHKKLKAKVDGVAQPSSAESLPQNSKDSHEKKSEDTEKTDETHCVYFNKSCLIGPFLDPEKVAVMPGSTAFAKPPAAVRFALEQVIDVATDPNQTMDAIQEGFCPKLFSKGKRKILKKGLFRFDTKLRAGRFLKRLCRKLKSCEYFLSFDPAKDPCPLQCQISGTTSLESFMTMKGMKAKNDAQMSHLDELRRKRGRPRKDDFEPLKLDNHSQREFNHSSESWISNVKSTVGTPVRVINPTSYHGRPLVPIAPGSKMNQSHVSIMPAGSQMQRVRPPPPYEINARASFVQPMSVNTVVTSSTQPRMVAPVNLRMISPTTQTTVISGHEPSTPTFAAQNVATVLVVTKPHTTGQPVSGLFSFRGNVPSHGLQLPLSPGSRKSQLGSNGARMKSPGTIKIHGPMIDQLPGAMNPMSQKHKVVFPPSTKIESPNKQHHKQPIHIPGNQNEKEAKVMHEYNRYRDRHHYEHNTPNQVHQFVEIKKNSDIKLEPSEHQQYQVSRSSPNNHNHIVPAIHIHHPASSSFHSLPTEEIQMRSNSVEILTHIPDRVINDNSARAVSTLTSPARSEFPTMRFEAASNQNMNRHGQPVRGHIPGQGHNQVGKNQTAQNHLHVSTTSENDPQSAISPLHSPPPLRPAPSNQHRSIALRSPPNLTPSTVMSHFDFSPVSTNTVISQPGHLYHQQKNNHVIVNSGHAETTELSFANVSTNNSPASSNNVTLAYIPVKTQASDKIVYVPFNQSTKNNLPRQQHQQQQQQKPIILYSKQQQQHHYQGRISDLHSPSTVDHNQTRDDIKVSQTSHDESSPGPFSGVTRKFTVRTLQRDPSALPSSLTTVRIQGQTLTELGPIKPEENLVGTFPISNVNISNRNNYEIRRNFESTGKSTNGVFKTASSSENIARFENLPRASGMNNENNRNNNDTDNFHQANHDYDEISDYEEDIDYDEYFDHNDANFDAIDQTHERKGVGYFRGSRRRGKRKFFVRRKGSTSHQYKVKYKQALEQAKFMREQRPSFMSANFQNEEQDEFHKIISNNENISNQPPNMHREDGLDVIKANSSTHADKNCDSVISNNHNNIEGIPVDKGLTSQNSNRLIKIDTDIVIKDNHDNHSSGFNANHDNHSNGFNTNHNSRMADLTADSNNLNCDKRFSPISGQKSEFVGKKKQEGKGPKRKRKANSAMENDFFYGQWMMTQDAQINRKRRNSSCSLLSPTKYLSDPLERVKLPPNPESWSESEVASFISATECSQYADTLKEQEIDGSALLLLTRESLMEFTGMKLGPALKICGYLAHLKGRIRMHQNLAVMQS